jgi:hypothetical protein
MYPLQNRPVLYNLRIATVLVLDSGTIVLQSLQLRPMNCDTKSKPQMRAFEFLNFFLALSKL